jgi:putative SOS response-associated peptidase YedK
VGVAWRWLILLQRPLSGSLEWIRRSRLAARQTLRPATRCAGRGAARRPPPPPFGTLSTMCGRYRLSTKAAQLEQLLGAPFDDGPSDIHWPARPRFNVAPTDEMPVLVLGGDGVRRLRRMRWGLASPKPGPAPAVFNARIETLDEKPLFRGLLRSHRCLVPADGFYEWRRDGAKKTPFLFSVAGDGVFCFGGLWASVVVDGARVDGFTIVTTRPTAPFADFHDRMPLLLRDDEHDAWLDGSNDVAGFADRGCVDGFGARAVSARLGSVAHDDAGVLVADPAGPSQGSLF